MYGRYTSILNAYKRDRVTEKLIPGVWACSEFEYLQNCHWTFHEKIDGMNIRVIFQDGELLKRGRTDKAKLPVPLLEELDHLFLPWMERFKDKSICFYGEGYGGKIQKGGKYSDKQRFILFDIKIGDTFVTRQTMYEIADSMSIQSVPHCLLGTLQDGIDMVEHGLYSFWSRPSVPFFAEGLVGRPYTPLYSRRGTRIQVKIKTRDFSPNMSKLSEGFTNGKNSAVDIKRN